jgi:hypothetical protein
VVVGGDLASLRWIAPGCPVGSSLFFPASDVYDSTCRLWISVVGGGGTGAPGFGSGFGFG